jgi:hypothetical protein
MIVILNEKDSCAKRVEDEQRTYGMLQRCMWFYMGVVCRLCLTAV